MKCYLHPEVDAFGGCVRCERFVCVECQKIWQGKVYCKPCYIEVFGDRESPPDVSVKKTKIKLSKTKIIIAALGTLLIVAVSIILSLSLQGTETQKASRYTADQVIVIVQARYPTCFKSEMIGLDAEGIFRYREVTAPAMISVNYIGGPRRAWMVNVKCPGGYGFNDRTSSRLLYFYEDTGTLTQQ